MRATPPWVYKTLMFGLYGRPPGKNEFLHMSLGEAHRWPEALTFDQSDRPIFWLDRLLKGGIHVPRDLGRPLRILVKGAPGLGKSLFVQQLLYCRLYWKGFEHWTRTRAQAKGAPRAPDRKPEEDFCDSLYVTAEASTAAILSNMRTLGMHLDPVGSVDADGLLHSQLRHGDDGIVGGADPSAAARLSFAQYREAEHRTHGWGIAASGNASVDRGLAANVIDGIKGLASRLGSGHRLFAVAFDSVNALIEPDASVPILEGLLNWGDSSPHPACVIFVYDEEAETNSMRWTHAADLVFQFHEEWSNGFLKHDFEIQKARFQNQVMGRHPLTILGLSREAVGSQRILENMDVDGPRPRLREGGVFVYPNHHYLIDEMRQGNDRESRRPARVESAGQSGNHQGLRFCEPRDQLVTGALGEESFRPGARVLLIGPLGSRRRQYIASTFAKLQDKPQDHGGSVGGLLISFAEPTSWFNSMLLAPGGAERWQGMSDEAKAEHRLKYPRLLQRPGSVLPAAFLNRLVYWLSQIKPRLVAIVGLDGIPALFPQLAAEPQFVPTVVEILRAHGAVSFLPIAGRFLESEGRLTSSYGLPEHASVVLGFEPRGKEKVRITWHKDETGWHSASSARYKDAIYDETQNLWSIDRRFRPRHRRA